MRRSDLRDFLPKCLSLRRRLCDPSLLIRKRREFQSSSYKTLLRPEEEHNRSRSMKSETHQIRAKVIHVLVEADPPNEQPESLPTRPTTALLAGYVASYRHTICSTPMQLTCCPLSPALSIFNWMLRHNRVDRWESSVIAIRTTLY